MFAALSLVSIAFLAFVQAAPGLKVALSLPEASERAAAGRLPIVEAKVINTGNTPLWIFPFNNLLQKGSPTHDFVIQRSGAEGEVNEPTFDGIRVRRTRPRTEAELILPNR